jgi:predicted GIY-YIG superfamily endonuclease
LQAQLAQMGDAPDYARLAEDVLSIRNVSPALARRLVMQALVIEDRRDLWTRIGARLCAAAPARPGVYVFRTGSGTLYVGKANNLQRRFRAHFGQRRWNVIPVALARVTDADWFEVGSELEALLREAELIRTLRPIVNTQVGPPSMKRRAVPSRLVQDLIVILPSIESESVELVAARTTGQTRIVRVRRDESDLPSHAEDIWTFFHDCDEIDHQPQSPIVFSWLAGRGADGTRLEMEDIASSQVLRNRLATALHSSQLFRERLMLVSRRACARSR